jgi:hypothetical protein
VVSQGSLTGQAVPYNIDLAILDPPYPGGVENYTDLSLIHYIILALFNDDKSNFSEIRQRDLSNLDLDRYFSELAGVVNRIRGKLSSRGSIYILFNSRNQAVWEKLFESIDGLCIHDIYYTLGESPGKLGRSGVRGLFIIHLKPCRSIHHDGIIIYDLLSYASKRFKIKLNMDLEYRCIESLTKALKTRYISNIILINNVLS